MPGPKPFKISIPVKPISWNVLARKNHWLYTKVFDEWKRATWAAVEEGRLRGIRFKGPVVISVECHWVQHRRHDVDSVVAKPVIDALVDMRVIPDDSLEFVREVRYSGQVGAGKDEMTVTVYPIC